eukprot:COSAG02_NODE_10218_length_1993_cov_1.457761_1_plen_82_part_00
MPAKLGTFVTFQTSSPDLGFFGFLTFRLTFPSGPLTFSPAFSSPSTMLGFFAGVGLELEATGLLVVSFELLLFTFTGVGAF